MINLEKVNESSWKYKAMTMRFSFMQVTRDVDLQSLQTVRGAN